jgi:ABC-2 type transport system ATP-binding protein
LFPEIERPMDACPVGSGKQEIVIRAEGLTRRFGDLIAVNRFDIEIHKGEVFGFLGPNGAGKSTLMRMLVGLLTPSEGEVIVLGRTIPKEADRLRSCLGYMTQRFSLYEDLSVEENLEFASEIFGLARARRRERIDFVIHEFGLERYRQARPSTMSGGWKQRLALAVSTVHDPALLFLDEPTAGVDPGSRRLFWEKLFELASGGTTILVSTHYMDEAVRCHRVCMLREGVRTALGDPLELTARLRGRVIEITARPIEEAMKTLGRHPLVVSVTQLGDHIHVLLAESAPADRVAVGVFSQALESSGFTQPTVRVAEPNLEDVFVTQDLRQELSPRGSENG